MKNYPILFHMKNFHFLFFFFFLSHEELPKSACLMSARKKYQVWTESEKVFASETGHVPMPYEIEIAGPAMEADM